MDEDTRKKIEKRIAEISKDITYKSKHGIPGEYLNGLYSEMRGLQWVLNGCPDESE